MIDCISREAVKSKKVYSVERHELVVPVAEIDWIPPADVVARDAFNRILSENDTMREMLAGIGKKPGDKMDDVRPVVRGKWIITFERFAPERICSSCKCRFPVSAGEGITEVLNFCTNCGADNREVIIE